MQHCVLGFARLCGSVCVFDNPSCPYHHPVFRDSVWLSGGSAQLDCLMELMQRLLAKRPEERINAVEATHARWPTFDGHIPPVLDPLERAQSRHLSQRLSTGLRPSSASMNAVGSRRSTRRSRGLSGRGRPHSASASSQLQGGGGKKRCAVM